MEKITYYVLSALAVLIILTLHEFAHGFVAYKLGDNTAKNLGRLTLNPLKHLDPFGALCMLFFHFGWAKPVPVNARNFKNPKKDFALVALAGPAFNLILAIISSFLYLLLFSIFSKVAFESKFLFSLVNNLLTFVFLFYSINLSFAIFNLIPIPPLDGSRLLNVILPEKWYFGIMQYEKYIYWGFVAWLLIGPYISSFLLAVPFIAANPVLSFIANLFSLSGMLSKLMNLISDGIFFLWKLIPFLNV